MLWYSKLCVVVSGIALVCVPPVAGAESAEDQLMRLLPYGFDSRNCGTSIKPIPSAVATVDCGQNWASSAARSATFGLFPDLNLLNLEFDYWMSTQAEVLTCPDGSTSPGRWHYDESPDSSAGLQSCGTVNGHPDVSWTEESTLLIGDIGGPDLDALYDYWLSPGGR